jgi:hypothetical protein
VWRGLSALVARTKGRGAKRTKRQELRDKIVLCGLFVRLFCCSTQNRWVVDPIAFAWREFGECWVGVVVGV